MSKDNDVIEIDEAVVNAVAEKATESIKSLIKEPATAQEIALAMAELQDKAVKKDVSDVVEGTIETNGKSELSKEMRFAMAVRAVKRNDTAGIADYNNYSLKAWSQKSDYQNVTTSADGGALVPDPEFIAEVERLTDVYGVASRLADLRTTDRDSVTMLSGTNEISFTSTSEATAQNAQKLTYQAQTVALTKYIATLVFTSEILEDSAINMWQDATNEIARARAKLIDQLVFTNTTDGLLYAPDNGEGWKTQTVGTAITDLDFDDLMNARYKVSSSVRANGRFFMHPTVWNVLRQKKSGDGVNASAIYYAGSPLEGTTPTVDGVPVELVDVMPAVGDITANEPFAVFGDLSKVHVHIKRALELKTFDSGTVTDAGGGSINLITQDAWAMRATTRVKTQVNMPAGFCVIGTGTVS